MWHFCLAVDLLRLCAERGFDTSRGSYTLPKWPLGWARDQKKNLRPTSPFACISTATLWGQHIQGVSQGSGVGKRPPFLSGNQCQDRGDSPHCGTRWLCVLGQPRLLSGSGFPHL